MLSNPTFWVAVGFVIFVAAVYRPIARGLGGALDKRADGIRQTLDDATKLREEAQSLLADYQRKQRDALKETEEMVVQAREHAETMAAEAKEALEVSLKRREQAALDKIAQAEADALRDVQAAAVDVAVAATRSLVTDRIGGDAGNALVGEAIKELPNRLQ